ncbi:MAG: hypothetical protein FGM24_07340 [Candidatus Kapabacteria bacterium]|nr:hypothetical protein [Candidatus Kapabacteria bacterium]
MGDLRIRAWGLILTAALVLSACASSVPTIPELEHPVVLVLYPEAFRVDDAVAADVARTRDSLRASNAARQIEESEAFSVDPDRAAILQYARFADGNLAANDLDHRLGSRVWNNLFTVLSFTLGDAMVHLDTAMTVRADHAVQAGRAVRAQYVVAMRDVHLDRHDGRRRCSVRMQVLHVPTDRVLLDTVVTTSDSTFATRTTLVRGGNWVSALDAAAARIAELPGPIIKRTLPRYVRRDSTMAARLQWFGRNLWPKRPDADLVSALAADTLQPAGAQHRWMLRSPDGTKAMVSTVSTFGGTVGLRFMRNAQGVVIYPSDQTDTARMAFTMYALERVDSTWYFDRVRTVFRNQPDHTDAEHKQFTFDALKALWYVENDGVPDDAFWQREWFRRIDGIPFLKYIHTQYN